VAHIGLGEYEEAYRTIRSANPFPSVCSRVCHHPCETVCRCGTTGGDPIAIRQLKRFVVDRVDASAYKYAVRTRPGAPRVAVIGAGPAGLTAAHSLSILGYTVTVFEKEAGAGGMLVAAIPEYRLPRAILQSEIDALINENVEIRYHQALGRDFTIDSLKRDGYGVVYVAIGSQRSKRLGLPGDDASGILPGIEFLKAYNLHGQETAKGRVGIIGGGNSALDAARVAIRQKSVDSVTVYYRRTRDEMPAYAEEIDAALEEGVRIETLVAPVGVKSRNGKLTGIEFQRNELGERDDSGRARPVPLPGSEFIAELDTLVVAISEEPESEALSGLKTTRWGSLVVNPESFVTSDVGVFGGGDVVTGPSTVIEAIAAGKYAAIMMDRYMAGKQLKKLNKVLLPTVYIAPVSSEDEGEGQGRMHPEHLSVDARVKNFLEVDLSPSENHALCEARRCLRCDIEFTESVRTS
jgi:NADH-quinone oxidoreductase subunit F